VNPQVASSENNFRGPSSLLRSEGSMVYRKLTVAVQHSGGVVGAAR